MSLSRRGATLGFPAVTCVSFVKYGLLEKSVRRPSQ